MLKKIKIFFPFVGWIVKHLYIQVMIHKIIIKAKAFKTIQVLYHGIELLYLSMLTVSLGLDIMRCIYR